MPLSCLIALALPLLFAGGCAIHRVPEFAPLFFGHYEMLSQSDRESLMAVANPRVSVLMPGAKVLNVKVFNANEVDVTFCRDFIGPAGDLYLKKAGMHWRVVIENRP